MKKKLCTCTQQCHYVRQVMISRHVVCMASESCVQAPLESIVSSVLILYNCD